MSTLFNESERELIEAARFVLSDGLTRLQSRKALFPTNRTKGREARAEIIEARASLTDYLVVTYGQLRHEVALVCLIDAQGRLISIKEFPQGKASHCEVPPRMLADFVIQSGAAAVILAHNHPSGENTPSPADIKLTEFISSWLKPMECELIDHLVISVHGASAIIGDF